jgi:hypothetical protein
MTYDSKSPTITSCHARAATWALKSPPFCLPSVLRLRLHLSTHHNSVSTKPRPVDHCHCSEIMTRQELIEGLPSHIPSSPPVTSESSSQTARPPSVRPGTKKASTACNECRRRKIRCDIGNPCANCIAHRVQCVYDELTDKRRKVAAKLAEQESQYYRDFLLQLLHTIRTEDEEIVQSLISVIRSGASHDQIFAMLGQDTGNKPSEPPDDFTWP